MFESSRGLTDSALLTQYHALAQKPGQDRDALSRELRRRERSGLAAFALMLTLVVVIVACATILVRKHW